LDAACPGKSRATIPPQFFFARPCFLLIRLCAGVVGLGCGSNFFSTGVVASCFRPPLLRLDVAAIFGSPPWGLPSISSLCFVSTVFSFFFSLSSPPCFSHCAKRGHPPHGALHIFRRSAPPSALDCFGAFFRFLPPPCRNVLLKLRRTISRFPHIPATLFHPSLVFFFFFFSTLCAAELEVGTSEAHVTRTCFALMLPSADTRPPGNPTPSCGLSPGL